MRRPAAAALAIGAVVAGVAASTQESAADVGAVAFQRCYACHSVEPGETDLPGPNLRGVVGRPIAAQPGFRYSAAMRAFAAREVIWTAALLDAFLAAPERVVPGTEMSMLGLRDAALRRAILDYLAAGGAAAGG